MKRCCLLLLMAVLLTLSACAEKGGPSASKKWPEPKKDDETLPADPEAERAEVWREYDRVMDE